MRRRWSRDRRTGRTARWCEGDGVDGARSEVCEGVGRAAGDGRFLREEFREKGEIGSVYDSNVTLPDPFPYSPDQESNDPILVSIIAPTTTAMVDFVTGTVGWKTDAQYYALSYIVGSHGIARADAARGRGGRPARGRGRGPEVECGDCAWMERSSCPFMGSLLTQNELPVKLEDQV